MLGRILMELASTLSSALSSVRSLLWASPSTKAQGPRTARALGLPYSCVQEALAYARVHAERFSQSTRVSAYYSADIGHRIDKGDFHSQEGIRRALCQLGGSEIRDYKRCPGVRKRAVDLTQNRFGGIAGGAYHDTIRHQRILDSTALTQELGVPNEINTMPSNLGRDCAERCRRARRDSRLADDHITPRDV